MLPIKWHCCPKSPIKLNAVKLELKTTFLCLELLDVFISSSTSLDTSFWNFLRSHTNTSTPSIFISLTPLPIFHYIKEAWKPSFATHPHIAPHLNVNDSILCLTLISIHLVSTNPRVSAIPINYYLAKAKYVDRLRCVSVCLYVRHFAH